MPARVITDSSPHAVTADQGRGPRETAPSIIREDEPKFARWIGLMGLSLVTLGSVAIVANVGGFTSRIGPVFGSFIGIIGLACLLFHAAREADPQIRRLYGLLGYLWLLAGIALTALPLKGPPGALFLPYGFLCLTLALLFLLPFTRNETEVRWHRATLFILGVAGVALAGTGLIGGNISENFLIPQGLLLALLGLAYFWAFIGLEGTSSNLGYRASLAIGGVGLLFFFVALARSVAPQLLFSMRWIQTRPAPYLVPSGLLLMLIGLMYAGVAIGLSSDNRLAVLTRRELASFFYSPIAYIVFFAFVICAWFGFYQYVGFLFPSPSPFDPGGGRMVPEPIVSFYILNWWPLISGIFLGVPLLTMRLMSEEQRTGTLEVLFTAPVTETMVVLSKFFAAFIFFFIALSPWGLYLIALRVEGGQPFEFRPLLTFLFALICSGAGFLSLGLFFSSLTRNQIASAILTAGGMLGLTAIFFVKRSLEGPGGQSTSAWAPVLERASYIDLWMTSLEGRVSPQQLVFWISFAVLWLFITIKVLESRKWR